MIRQKDYELIAEVIYDLPHFRGGQSHGAQRRTIALRLARIFGENDNFDEDKFLLRAVNGIESK